MKRIVSMVVGCVLFLACGVPPEEAAVEPLGSLSSALCNTSTQCGSGQLLQCSGNVCSSVSGDSITCDGVTVSCLCTIDGVSYPDGAENPSNSCQWCDTAVSNTSWTNIPDFEVSRSVCKGNGTCGLNECRGYPCDPNGDGAECVASCANGQLTCGFGTGDM
ncbi:MAG: hypothetical protein EOO71_06700 [Myxococcaceae bacterium]|nr:MAG: hypothetical protein EOO71_06700 [Myxococcaceae bacterium]